MVCNFKSSHHWPLLVARERSYFNCEFIPLFDNDPGFFFFFFFFPALKEVELDNVWFQQDGATAHTARISMDFLREVFPRRGISLRGDVNWPALLPDLAPCDYLFIVGLTPIPGL